MSVLIKNMTMPKSCDYCRFCLEEDIMFETEFKCDLTGKFINGDYERNFPDDCPLVELPEKHGDLIDRNDLKKEYAMGFDCNNCVSNQKSCEHDAFYAKMDFCLMLDDASVVIEAEDE